MPCYAEVHQKQIDVDRHQPDWIGSAISGGGWLNMSDEERNKMRQCLDVDRHQLDLISHVAIVSNN